MSIRPWRVLESNYLRKNVRIDVCETSNGKIIEPLVLEYGTWVTIVALTKQQEVLLIKQYRHGAQKILWELPGGAVNEDEVPIVAAKRELLEETGYSSNKWVLLGSSRPNPAIQSNTIYHYLALDCEKTAETSFDENESIATRLLPEKEVENLIMKGTISHSLVVAAFYYLKVFSERS